MLAHHGVADTSQAYVLRELLRYLEHPRSGAQIFEDMGAHWVRVRDGVLQGTLRSTDREPPSVIERFDQLTSYLCLHLGGLAGRVVVPLVHAGTDNVRRREYLADEMCRMGTLTASLSLTGVAGPQLCLPPAEPSDLSGPLLRSAYGRLQAGGGRSGAGFGGCAATAAVGAAALLAGDAPMLTTGTSRGMPDVVRALKADGPAATILIRLLVGAVFVSEGIQKFWFPDKLGPGRFDKIGIPAPGFFAYFDGVVEIVCGGLLLVGLLTRLACLPLLVDICLAIVLTKLRELQPGGFLGVSGFWAMAHDARTDWSMLLGLLFLLISGPGRYSVDALLAHRLTGRQPAPP